MYFACHSSFHWLDFDSHRSWCGCSSQSAAADTVSTTSASQAPVFSIPVAARRQQNNARNNCYTKPMNWRWWPSVLTSHLYVNARTRGRTLTKPTALYTATAPPRATTGTVSSVSYSYTQLIWCRTYYWIIVCNCKCTCLYTVDRVVNIAVLLLQPILSVILQRRWVPQSLW